VEKPKLKKLRRCIVEMCVEEKIVKRQTKSDKAAILAQKNKKQVDAE